MKYVNIFDWKLKIGEDFTNFIFGHILHRVLHYSQIEF